MLRPNLVITAPCFRLALLAAPEARAQFGQPLVDKTDCESVYREVNHGRKHCLRRSAIKRATLFAARGRFINCSPVHDDCAFERSWSAANRRRRRGSPFYFVQSLLPPGAISCFCENLGDKPGYYCLYLATKKRIPTIGWVGPPSLCPPVHVPFVLGPSVE